ncbi:MAG: tRNA (adenosine(37)-N6)-dimethylallyltransferase MiaA [bacterium]
MFSNHSNQNQIFCLMGPTAAGKTALAIELTKHFPFDIISVDSAMVYRGMDIGTAKPTLAELKVAPHRLINICDPAEAYSAGQFRQDAIAEIEKIFALGRVPLLVGGTMLYFRVLQQGISNLPQASKEIRAEIAGQIEKLGLEEIYRQLQKIDPQTTAVIKPTDSQRIGRALEVFKLTGKKLSELKSASPPQKLPFKFINIAVAPLERLYLQNKINLRFREMLRLGFIEEVEQLHKREDLHFDLPSIRTVGYRQAWQYFSCQITYDQMLQRIPIATRQLAKRQLTWLRSWSEVKWFDSESPQLIKYVTQLVATSSILQ